MIIPQAPASEVPDTPAASEEADAAFLRLAHPGSLVWFGRQTHEWWAMPPRAQHLLHDATVGGLAVRWDAEQAVRHHAPP